MSTGRQVSASIPTIGYRDRTDHPWPRILQIVAIITLIYAAARIGLTIPGARLLWRSSSTSGFVVSGSDYFFMAIGSLIEVVIGLLLIMGAVNLLRSGSQRLILAGHWAIVVLWFVTFLAWSFLRPGSETLSFLFNSILGAFHMNSFPIMVILILRAHHAR